LPDISPTKYIDRFGENFRNKLKKAKKDFMNFQGWVDWVLCKSDRTGVFGLITGGIVV
jgi:hypothetical protein